MEPTEFFSYLAAFDPNELAIVAGISITIMIALIPPFLTLMKAKRRPNFHNSDSENNNQMLFTVYRDTKGKIKVFKH